MHYVGRLTKYTTLYVNLHQAICFLKYIGQHSWYRLHNPFFYQQLCLFDFTSICAIISRLKCLAVPVCLRLLPLSSERKETLFSHLRMDPVMNDDKKQIMDDQYHILHMNRGIERLEKLGTTRVYPKG